MSKVVRLNDGCLENLKKFIDLYDKRMIEIYNENGIKYSHSISDLGDSHVLDFALQIAIGSYTKK